MRSESESEKGKMEGAGKAKESSIPPSWDEMLPDVISVLLYLQEADGGVQVLLCGEGGLLRLPRRKVGQGQEKAGSPSKITQVNVARREVRNR